MNAMTVAMMVATVSACSGSVTVDPGGPPAAPAVSSTPANPSPARPDASRRHSGAATGTGGSGGAAEASGTGGGCGGDGAMCGSGGGMSGPAWAWTCCGGVCVHQNGHCGPCDPGVGDSC